VVIFLTILIFFCLLIILAVFLVVLSGFCTDFLIFFFGVTCFFFFFFNTDTDFLSNSIGHSKKKQISWPGAFKFIFKQRFGVENRKK
jgi:hypothetical protein